MTYGELRMAYRAKAIALHPDLGGNHDDMLQLNAEYDHLIQSANDVIAEPEHWGESASDAIKLSQPIKCFINFGFPFLAIGMYPNCQPVFLVFIDDSMKEEYNALKPRSQAEGQSKTIMLEPSEFAKYWSMRQIEKQPQKRKPKQKSKQKCLKAL